MSDPESDSGKQVAAAVRGVDWLYPHYLDEEGSVRIAFQMYIIESPSGVRIAVDTCVGNDKQRSGRPWATNLQTSFLTSLSSGGFDPESIDFVLCTHFHYDHVGWNTKLSPEGKWVPTFPNASYLFPSTGWEAFSIEAKNELQDREVFSDSCQPIVDAGLQKLVPSDYVIVDEDTCKVHLMPTEGHTTGHVSVVIESKSHHFSAIITGDCVHHPVQLAYPYMATVFDSNAPVAADTRANLLEQAKRDRSVIIGTHFAQPSAGYVRCDGKSYRFDPVLKDDKRGEIDEIVPAKRRRTGSTSGENVREAPAS